MNNCSYIGSVKWEANVGGMDCASCAAKIERVVRQFEEVEEVRVDVTLGRMSLELPEGFDAMAIRSAVEGIGYEVQPIDASKPTRPKVERPPIWKDRRLLAVALGALATTFATIANLALGLETLAVAAYVAAILLGGVYVFRHAWSSIRHLHLDINVLMTIAVVGAAIIGEWFEAATVVVLFAFAEWLEGASMTRARRAIRDLMDLAPPMARVRRHGREEEVAPEGVRPGEVVIVRPGEKIPLDGVVRAGRSEVDQSPITGESMPVSKSPGDEVFAGTLNARGGLEIEVTSEASESTIAHVLRAIEEAQANRSESERFIERFAKWYTPAVVVLAVLIAAVPPLLFAGAFEVWFYRALVLLVVACPCALVIATPITTVSALARAAHDGILIKGGRFLEHLGRLRAVVFDKTGTLTQGRPQVGEVLASEGWSSNEVLRIAALAEQRSEHYIARAIVEEVAERSLKPSPHKLVNFEAHPGAGVVAEIELCDVSTKRPRGFGVRMNPSASEARDDHAYHDHEAAVVAVGTRKLLDELNVEFAALDPEWRRLEEKGSTVVGVAQDGRLVGLIECADLVRDTAGATVARLRELGVREMRVCTGDNVRAAAELARVVGLPAEAVHANLLPADKVSILDGLRAQSAGTVAMVGDGINDAPALARADVGIAMGAAGTDVALESAHVALMGDDLSKLPQAIELGRATVAIIRQNVVLALAIKALVLALAAAGLATLWMAIAADMGTSLLVIGNGLRLLKTPSVAKTA